MAYTPLSELTASMGNYYELVIKPSYEQDISNNQVKMQVSYGVRKTGANSATYNLDGAHFWASFNGVTVPGADGSVIQWDQRLDAVGTYHEFVTYSDVVQCANDGTSSVTLYAKFDVGAVSAAKDAEINRTIALPQVPRASLISATPTYIGQATIITVQKASPNFTHTITARCGDYTATVGHEKRSDTSISWVVPGDLYQYTPGMTNTVSLQCMTYNGNHLVGQSSCSFTVSVMAATSGPSLADCEVTEANLLVMSLGIEGTFIRYLSVPFCYCTASAQKSATVQSVMVNGHPLTYHSDYEPPSWSDEIGFTDTGTFVFTVTDSRGLTSTVTKSLTLIPYEYVSLKYSWARTTAVSSTVNLSLSGRFFNGSFGQVTNSLTVRVAVKRVNDADWGTPTTVTPTITQNTWTGSVQLNGINYENAYDVEIVAYDALGEYAASAAKATFTIPPGVPVFDWGRNDFTVNKRLRLGSDVQVLNSSSEYVTAAQVKTDNYLYIGAEPNADLTGTKIQGQIVQIGASNLGRRTTVYGNPLVIYLDNYDSRINMYKAAGGYISFLFMDKNDTLQIGDNSVSMYLHGKTISSNVAISQSSDRNRKKAVEPLSDDYEKLLDGMEPCRYRYKDEADNDPYHLGYIAQDVLAALNNAGLNRSDFAAVVGEDGDLGIAYTELIPLLHIKIKTLEDRVEQLEAMIQGGGAV